MELRKVFSRLKFKKVTVMAAKGEKVDDITFSGMVAHGSFWRIVLIFGEGFSNDFLNAPLKTLPRSSTGPSARR